MSSRLLLSAVLVPLVWSLSGCSTPPEDVPPGGLPPGDVAGAPGNGAVDPNAPPPVDGAATPGTPPIDGMGKPVSVEDLKFARFIEPGAETVTITVRVEGAAAGQIDIQSL